jgi:murein L,D-transpeptidase YafK
MRTRFFPALLLALLSHAALAAPDLAASEAGVSKSIEAIRNNRLDLALNEVDSVLRVNPNFRLAQLIRGDLLMAHAGALSNIGSGANAPREKLDDLRAEARARLQRMQAQPNQKIAPRFLWQLDAAQKYALVVDTSRSTLYVYENVNGAPRYVADYYITIGKLGTEKRVEGDQRTPIGVYFIKAELPKAQLADMYGSGAFPLSYPNEWDKKNNRTGQGIWLHGTPSDTYSRPPRASNGCVVLSNDNLEKLAPYLQVGITPVIITNHMEATNAEDTGQRDQLRAEIEQWRKDWSSLNTRAYLAHYSPDFASDSQNYNAWAAQKTLVNAGKEWAKVNVSNISMFTYPEQPDMVVVNFNQDYASSNLSNQMRKRQYWIKQNNHWKILYEGAA